MAADFKLSHSPNLLRSEILDFETLSTKSALHNSSCGCYKEQQMLLSALKREDDDNEIEGKWRKR